MATVSNVLSMVGLTMVKLEPVWVILPNYSRSQQKAFEGTFCGVQ